MKLKSLQKIIDRVGGQKAVAEEMCVDQRTVSWWLNHGVPAKHVPGLVKLDQKHGGSTKPHQLNRLFDELRTKPPEARP